MARRTFSRTFRASLSRSTSRWQLSRSCMWQIESNAVNGGWNSPVFSASTIASSYWKLEMSPRRMNSSCAYRLDASEISSSATRLSFTYFPCDAL